MGWPEPCRLDFFFLPMFQVEKEWAWWIRLPLYIAGLCWTFLGIAIISDIFMAGIEKVTSVKRRVEDAKTGRTITVHVWNATVANLTLMALGSSAPEILLSIIEICTNDFFLGDLGAGTIVGSAAFNLLCISAVCVMAIPDGETRKIKEVPVYVVTSFFSIFAYLWLLFVLMCPPSPNVCEIWEAVVTLIFFPVLVFLAYMADRGYFARDRTSIEKEMMQVIPENVTKDELAMIEQQIRELHGFHLTPDQVVSVMSAKYFTPRSRAYYRHAAMQQTLGMKKVDTTATAATGSAPDFAVMPVPEACDNLDQDRRKIEIGFASSRYAFLENCGTARLILERTGGQEAAVSVKYATRDGTAVAGQDYEAEEGTITFAPSETTKVLQIKILDDCAYEENEEFYVDLSQPTVVETNNANREAKNHAIMLSSIDSVTVVIIDDDEPGNIRFTNDQIVVVEGVEEIVAQVVVERVQGASGTIACSYHTEEMGAKEGMDYREALGRIELGPSVQSFVIPVTILPKGRFEHSAGFNVILDNPEGCKFYTEPDGGAPGAPDSCVCHVIIKGAQSHARKTIIETMEVKIASHQVSLGHKHWREQFYAALFVVNDNDKKDDEDDDDDDDDEHEGPTRLDYFVHFISVPWKLLFACVPPPDFFNGYACFVGALCMIALVTAIVGDMANLVGCVLDINPEITAITFVALGTSLPDTFASKTAASMDPHADASIGNITGSNSVNVFLGLGISWSIAAFYWQTQEPTGEWLERVNIPGKQYYCIRDDVLNVMGKNTAVFVVPQGSLWVNLTVFCCNAFVAIQHLLARRKRWGGELGGPKQGFMGQYFSAVFLISQWFLYVMISSIVATTMQGGKDDDC